MPKAGRSASSRRPEPGGAVTPLPAMRSMTVIAQDPNVRVNGRHGSSLMATISIPAEHLIVGPMGSRLQVARTLLPTLPGKHGKTQSKTEVPRRTLLEALKEQTILLNTNDLTFGADPDLCHELVIQP